MLVNIYGALIVCLMFLFAKHFLIKLSCSVKLLLHSMQLQKLSDTVHKQVLLSLEGGQLGGLCLGCLCIWDQLGHWGMGVLSLLHMSRIL